MKHVAEHQTTEFTSDPVDPWCYPGKVPPPRRIDYRELERARQSLLDAMYRFLLRCRDESLIDKATFLETTARFRIATEAGD